MIKADNTQKRCFVACDEQTRKNGRCSCLTNTHQSLQLQQTGVIASCSNTYIGKEFVYTSRITNCKTIFKVARTDDRYGQTILVSENKNRYFLGDVIPHN